MYCKNCGKFIGNDADLCEDCETKDKAVDEVVFSEFPEKEETKTPVYPKAEPCDSGMEVSLGKPIAAIVLSTVGFFMIYLGLILVAQLMYYDDVTTSIVFMFLGLVPSILGLIFGIQSIKHFKATAEIKSGKRIPVLILGISAVVTAGVGLFIALLMFMIYAML